MRHLNRDTIVAIAMLAFCGVSFWQTLSIRETSYESIGSEVWPQSILALIVGLTLIYLTQSLRDTAPPGAVERFRLGAFVSRYRNALWCYALFLGFLLVLPYLGMLVSGVLFVFLTLTAIGNRSGRDLVVHAAIAVGTVGIMWAIFTFALRVILPAGELLNI